MTSDNVTILSGNVGPVDKMKNIITLPKECGYWSPDWRTKLPTNTKEKCEKRLRYVPEILFTAREAQIKIVFKHKHDVAIFYLACFDINDFKPVYYGHSGFSGFSGVSGSSGSVGASGFSGISGYTGSLPVTANPFTGVVQNITITSPLAIATGPPMPLPQSETLTDMIKRIWDKFNRIFY